MRIAAERRIAAAHGMNSGAHRAAILLNGRP